MAEPPRRLDDEGKPEQVYDEPGTAPSSPKPDLKALEGSGDSNSQKDSHEGADDKNEPSQEDIADAENAPFAQQLKHENQLGHGYRKSAAKKTLFPRLTSSRGRKFLIGGGIFAGGIAAIIAIFLSLLPLKILSIVNNLQSHFYASSENAVQRETDSLFSGYVKNTIFCPSRRGNCSIVCAANPVSCLWKTWKNNKLEDKLAKNYGIEFKKSGGNYYMKAPGLSGNGLNIDGFVNDKTGETLDEFLSKDNSSQFTRVSRGELRQAVRDSLSGETRWKRTMYRFKVGRLLEEKYGIKRCIIFCGTKDALADSVQAQKNAAKLYLVERVIQPRDQSLAVVLKCFFDQNCDPTKTKPTETTAVPCEADIDCELNGAPENPETDTAIRTSLEDLAASYGVKDASELTSMYSDIESKGFDTYIIKYVMNEVFGVEVSDATAESLSKAIPLIGWLNMAAQLVHFSDQAPAKLKKLSYLTNAGAVVGLYAMYRTYADEMKTGNVSANEVGSFVNSLGPVAADANMADLRGGTASAEQTPLYSNLIGDRSGTGSKTYVCSNDKPPAGGSGTNLICPEEKIAVDSSFFLGLKAFVDATGLKQIAEIWNATIGVILHFFGNLITWITSPLLSTIDKVYCHKVPIVGYNWSPFGAYCEARDLIAAATQKIISFATTVLFPSPISENMSGGRTFDMMAAGADVSGNDFAHNGLGGQKLTNQQSADILAQQDQQDFNKFKQESFIARIFDTNSSYSVVNKLAIAMPNTADSLQASVSNIFSNPFHKIASAFTSVFGAGHAFAAATAQPDPFSITQYGYPLNDPRLAAANRDPEAYWDSNCANGKQTEAWNTDASSSSNIDPNTGMPMNTYTDPCLLIKAAASSGGGLFDSSMLSQDDLGSQ